MDKFGNIIDDKNDKTRNEIKQYIIDNGFTEQQAEVLLTLLTGLLYSISSMYGDEENKRIFKSN